MKSLNLCIDIDGTITEPYYWIPRASDYFKTHIEYKNVIFYDVHKVLGISPEEYREFYNFYGELLHKEARIRFGAARVINNLYTCHKIHLVTAREEKMRQVTLEWLLKYKIPMNSISLLGSHDKVFKAKELKSDLFIEDRYENALQLAQAGFDVLLVDCYYNQGDLPSNVTRVKHWIQIEKIINSISQQYNQLDQLKVAL